MKAADTIELFNLNETWSKKVMVTSVAKGAHPDEVSYIRSQYPNEEDFLEWYDEEDYETIYLSDGCYIETNLLTGVSTHMGEDEVDWHQTMLYTNTKGICTLIPRER